MGRAKLKMEMIGNEKKRNLTFKKRREDSRAHHVMRRESMYDNLQDSWPDVWPQDRDEVRGMLDVLYTKKKGTCGNKKFGLGDFFNDRKKKIEGHLSKVRKRNMEANVGLLKSMNEGQLRNFAVELQAKADLVKAKIEVLKGRSQYPVDSILWASFQQESESNDHHMLPLQPPYVVAPPQSPNEDIWVDLYPLWENEDIFSDMVAPAFSTTDWENVDFWSDFEDIVKYNPIM